MPKSLIYKGVYAVTRNGKNMFRSNHSYNKVIWQSNYFNSEIEAAKAYDIRLITLGFKPVNVLKPKL